MPYWTNITTVENAKCKMQCTLKNEKQNLWYTVFMSFNLFTDQIFTGHPVFMQHSLKKLFFFFPIHDYVFHDYGLNIQLGFQCSSLQFLAKSKKVCSPFKWLFCALKCLWGSWTTSSLQLSVQSSDDEMTARTTMLREKKKHRASADVWMWLHDDLWWKSPAVSIKVCVH